MSLIMMQHSVDFDLEEIESRLYSQVFHSSENWDQNPNHPVLNINKVTSEPRQVTTYSVNNNSAVNASTRYWDAKTQSPSPTTQTQPLTITNTNENPANNTEKTTPITSVIPENNKPVVALEEYIEFSKTNEEQTDVSKDVLFVDEVHIGQKLFCNKQDKLVQQSKIQNTNNLKNNNNNNNHHRENVVVEPDDIRLIHITNEIEELQKDPSIKARNRVRHLRRRLKQKRIKLARNDKQQLKKLRKEEKRQLKLAKESSRSRQDFSFVQQFNNIQRNNKTNQNYTSNTNPVIVENPTEINVNTKQQPQQQQQQPQQQQQQEIIKTNINPDGAFVISDSDSDDDDVIEIPMPEVEIVCIDDSSSDNSDTDDTDCLDDPTTTTTTPTKYISSNSEESNVPNSPKLENINESEITQPKSECEITNKTTETSKNEEPKEELMKDIEDNEEDNEEKIDEIIKSPQQHQNTNEIEKERAELLCTPDSNTNDFMAHDVCNLTNKTNFTFNFDLHDPELSMTGKEISKRGPSITDVYETESSCSEAGPPLPNKDRSYFNEVDFENPIKEIFAEPDLQKFSSFITPIRNRNITNVANSTPEFLTPVKTKAGTVEASSFQLDVFQNRENCDGLDSGSEYNSDPTELPTKKKNKKKKKKAKQNNSTDETKEDTIETEPSNTETPNKNKKKKKRRKAITYEELKDELRRTAYSSIDTDSPVDNTSKDKKKKKKNKRKSDQMENDSDSLDPLNKKSKNVTNNLDNDINLTEESPLKNNTHSYFADDILFDELKNKPSTSSATNNSCNNEIIDIDTVSSGGSPEANIEKSSFVQTFNISSDSETEIVTQQISDENTSSSNSGNNIVLNIFSPKISTENNAENMVANPYSFVQSFEKIKHNRKSFKDFWTKDMNRFYNNSWGHEDYDLNQVQQSMPAEFSKWPINPEDQMNLKAKKRGPLCLRCREYGHVQFRCQKPREPIKCNTCGDPDHITSRCPKSICTTCRSSTQHHTTSCNNCSNFRTIRCAICNYIGHLSRDCPDLWRRYHLTTHDNNSLVESNQMMKPPNQLWCSNCASRGHSANNCNYLRTDHFPTYPGIQNYTPYYNTVPSLVDMPRQPDVPVRFFENVNLSQIRNRRQVVVENNNKKYLNIIKNLRNKLGSGQFDENVGARLNYLQRAAHNDRFNKRKIDELMRISKILGTHRR